MTLRQLLRLLSGKPARKRRRRGLALLVHKAGKKTHVRLYGGGKS